MENEISVGIAITTRNRNEVLDLCMEKFAEHKPKCKFKFVIIDDCSDHPDRSDYSKIIEKYPFAEYHKNPERLGIAKSKNQCLKHVKECDYIFLCDDDLFPISDDWYQFFIDHSERTGCQHFSYQTDAAWLGLRDCKNGINEFNNSAGVMLFLTKKVIETIGGYDNRMIGYGMEHSSFTRRIHDANLMNGYAAYCCPIGASDHIFSLDLDMNCGGKRPPHRPDYHLGKYEFYSSVEGEQQYIQETIAHNSRWLYNYGDLYKEIE